MRINYKCYWCKRLIEKGAEYKLEHIKDRMKNFCSEKCAKEYEKV